MVMQETSEHTSSYYAATAHWQTHYPLLAGELRALFCTELSL
jgi:hypothetical protein